MRARKIAAMREVIVLHAARTGQPAGTGTLLDRLPYAYRLELERRDERDKAASLQALSLLAAGVRRLRAAPFEPARLSVPAGGKPSLEGGPWFSIAHSASRVTVALSDGGELGLDVEDLGVHGLDRAAVERWTAIEATLKAVGAGLRRAAEVQLSPHRATASIAGVTVHTRGLALADDCVATLATLEPVGRVQVEEWRGA
jgi:phosphopantetheinyl transferase